MNGVIIDPDRLFADAVRPILEARDFEIVLCRNGEEGLEKARLLVPDLVLIELALAGMSGIEVGRQIRSSLPQAKVFALTGTINCSMAGGAMGAGFHGFISKDATLAHFLRSIDSGLSGKVIRPPIFEMRVSPVAESYAALLTGQLTPREVQVLGWLVDAATSDEIAAFIGVSPNTVRTHIQNVLTKLQVHSRVEAAAFAVRHGIVEPGAQRLVV